MNQNERNRKVSEEIIKMEKKIRYVSNKYLLPNPSALLKQDMINHRYYEQILLILFSQLLYVCHYNKKFK